MDLFAGWGGADSAQDDTFQGKGVCGPEKRSDVVDAADVVQYDDQRIFMGLGKFFGREAPQFRVGDFTHNRGSKGHKMIGRGIRWGWFAKSVCGPTPNNVYHGSDEDSGREMTMRLKPVGGLSG